MSLRGDKRTEFPQSVRKAAFIRCCVSGNQPGVPQCESCGNVLRSGGIIYEHVQPDGLGGEPTLENCKVHCVVCAHVKTVTEDNPRMRKADAVAKRAYGLLPAKRKKIQSQGFQKSTPQRRASSPIEKWRGF
jgi:5-methylcytosine-specific restriction endonuclease McrA